VLSLVLYALVALLSVAVLWGLAVAVLPKGEQITPPVPDQAPWQLPEAEVTADDVARARLPVSWRGYRFEETDLLLDRLAEELRARDAHIAELEEALDALDSRPGSDQADRPDRVAEGPPEPAP
jgi:DivIVA domain-containing protein